MYVIAVSIIVNKFVIQIAWIREYGLVVRFVVVCVSYDGWVYWEGVGAVVHVEVCLHNSGDAFLLGDENENIECLYVYNTSMASCGVLVTCDSVDICIKFWCYRLMPLQRATRTMRIKSWPHPFYTQTSRLSCTLSSHVAQKQQQLDLLTLQRSSRLF